MKKILLTLFGIGLFVAGSAYTRRQAEFVAHQRQAAVSADKAPEAARIRPQLKQTVTYQLVGKRRY